MCVPVVLVAGGGADPPAQGHHGARGARLGAGQAPGGGSHLHQTQIPPGKAVKNISLSLSNDA